MYKSGVDIVEIKRIKNAIKRYGNKFLKRVYSKEEIKYCQNRNNPYPSYAVRFAAKEAFIKYNNGLKGLRIKDIQIKNDNNGKPFLYVNDRKIKCSVSLSHSRNNAIAFIIGGNNEDLNK